MAVQQCSPAGHRRQGQLKPAGRALGVDEFFEQLSPCRQRLGRRAGQQRRKLVAQGQQAGGFEADDRDAGSNMRRQRVDRALRLMPRFIDQAGGKKGPAAAQRPAARRIGHDDAIAGTGQHALGRARVVGLEIAVEGIDQQDDLGPGPRR